MPTDPWVLLAVVAVPVTGKIIMLWLALRKTQPADRPQIITALAELFRWRLPPRPPRGPSRRRASR